MGLGWKRTGGERVGTEVGGPGVSHIDVLMAEPRAQDECPGAEWASGIKPQIRNVPKSNCGNFILKV